MKNKIKEIVKAGYSKITKETMINDLLVNEKAVEALFEMGMMCIGCPMGAQETIEQGCLAHGMNEKDIDKLIKKINSEKSWH